MRYIKFKSDKNKKTIAYWRHPLGGWYRMGLKEAKLMISTGKAKEIEA
jgi:hypothetical protein